MEKYYAVRKGRKPGIYTDWETCKKQVHGFGDAQYKSFKTLDEANSYLKGSVGKVIQSDDNFAYVDGSYDASTGMYGFGGFLRYKKDGVVKFEVFRGSGKNSELAAMRNVGGEIKACEAAVRTAINLGLKELKVYYDYAGIANWAIDAWDCNKNATQAYKNYMQNAMRRISIQFCKVIGHTGVLGNEIADDLAKEASGISDEFHLDEYWIEELYKNFNE